MDEGLLRVARTRCHGPGAERSVAAFSRLGEHAGVWLAIGAAGAVLDAPRRASWRRALGAVTATYALNTALKLVVRRRRPALRGLEPLLRTPTALSFPSAHASTSFAGALSYSRVGLRARPLFALALGLSLSRLYLGLHYPSDVAAGAALGTAVAGALAGRRPGTAGETAGREGRRAAA